MDIYGWDFKVEGELVQLSRVVYGWGDEISGDGRPANKVRAEFGRRMIGHIRKGYQAGLSRKSMEKCMRANLVVYGYDATTFPMGEWFEAAYKGRP